MVKSIIDDAIKSNLESLDSYSTSLLQHIDQLHLDCSKLAPSIDSKLTLIKDSFYQTFNLSNKLLSKSQTKNKNVSINQDKLVLSNLKETVSPYKNGLISSQIYEEETFKSLDPSTKSDIETICKLEKMVLIYNLSLLYIIMSNKLLKKTIPLSKDIEYFDNLLNSKFSFGIYCLQNSPLELYHWGKELCKDLSEFTTTDSSNEVQTPNWVPTFADNFYLWLVNFKNLLVRVIKENSHKIASPNFFLIKNFQKPSQNPRFDFISTILGIPFYSIRQGILTKKQNLVHLQQSNAIKLGLLLNELPNLQKFHSSDEEVNIEVTMDFLDNEILFENVNETVDKLETSFEGGDPLEKDSTNSDFNSSFIKLNKLINQLIPIHGKETKTTISENSKPSVMVRYWILGLLGLIYIPSTANTLIERQLEIRQWIQLNLIDSIKGFYNNWILKPLNQILATVRHDSSSEIAIMSQKSLSSDLDSLTRMAIDLAIDDNSPKLNDVQLEQLKIEISKSIQAGDLTSIMRNYEEVLKSPMSNLIKGKLLRNLLIQIQKLKVDGDVAMNGIDKLLKSQELVFTVVALSPSLLVIYYILSSVNSYWQNGISRFNSTLKPKITSCLNNIERLLTMSQGQGKDYGIDGLILLEVIELRSLGMLIIPRGKKYEWIRDCNDLLDNEFGTEFKLKTVLRIWNVYSGYM